MTPLIVAAATVNLMRIREYVRTCSQQVGANDFDAYNIALAVDEACANLIQHAYQNDASKEIGVQLSADEFCIRIEITDSSPPFDPKSATRPDMRRYFLERRHHGLGILLMSRIMDSIEYSPAHNDDTRNTLVLIKRR